VPRNFLTDKVTHGYLPPYLQIAGEIGARGRVCEIGVHLGGSLDMWRALLPEGVIVGVDSNEQARWPGGTVRIVCEQTDPALAGLVQPSAPFDLIVDDASHEGVATRRTWELLWPALRDGGWYVIEDWMVGFPSWAGPGPCQPSMLTMARSFLDCLERPGDVESVTYRYGLIILRKTR
jgi:hypothetical protein